MRMHRPTPFLLSPVVQIPVIQTPQDEQPYIIEANPRASRTVPFVAKAVGHPIAKYASLLMSGKTLKDLNFTKVGAGEGLREV